MLKNEPTREEVLLAVLEANEQRPERVQFRLTWEKAPQGYKETLCCVVDTLIARGWLRVAAEETTPSVGEEGWRSHNDLSA